MKIEKTVEDLSKQANDLIEESKRLDREVRELEQRVRIARGTKSTIRSNSEYFVGDEGPTPELLKTVERLLRERPMTFQDLLDATGARENRIKGVIVRLQREERPVVNLGTDRKALWFIPDPEILKRLTRGRIGR